MTIPEIIRDLKRGRFFGSLEIKFEAGRAAWSRRPKRSSQPNWTVGTTEVTAMIVTPEPTDHCSRPAGDFISTYADYADVLEAPRAMHEAVAEQLIATVLNKNGVWISHGANRYSLDHWQVLLSESGGGRSTLIGMADEILKAAALQTLIVPAHWGSPQALYQQMANNPHGLFVWGELSERLKELSEKRFAGAKPWLTDRYDSFSIPDTISYRVTGRSSATPPIVFSEAPRINILATSSEDWFFTNLQHDDSTGGFMPRWAITRAGAPGRIVPTPKRPDPKLVQPLADHLSRAAALSGEAEISSILPEYESWYLDARRRFYGQPNAALARPYFARHRVHALKLAVIYEVSKSLSLKVSFGAWRRAVQKAAELEKTIFSLLPTAMSKEGYALEQMAERIRAAGPEGLAQSMLTREFQHRDPRERERQLFTLLAGERLHRFSRATPGRTARYLVHSDHTPEYVTRHPGDTPQPVV